MPMALDDKDWLKSQKNHFIKVASASTKENKVHKEES